jgi:hypothetical protein
MNVPTRLAAFAGVIGLAFGAAGLAGAAIDPAGGDQAVQAGAGHGDAQAGHGGGEAAHGAEPAAGDEQAMTSDALGGLAVALDGYLLRPERTAFTAGRDARFAFQVLGPDGHPLRDQYQVESERRMHLIVVRRDGAGYQHLHPTMAPDGTWSTPLRLPSAGVYRAYADFQVGGRKRTLATDLVVPGRFEPRAWPQASDTATTGPYEVTLRADALRAGRETELSFAVTRDGRSVDDLGRYLGAKGHLVALREHDLAYLHVHPDEASAANRIDFMAELPSPGRYRLYLQFQHDGAVRTVESTVEVPR